MTISTYSELLGAVSEWMDRSDLSGNAADFVRLGEARLNRIVDTANSDATITGTASSRRIDASALNVIKPIGLFLSVNGGETEVKEKADGTFPYSESEGAPTFYAMDGDRRYIDFDCPLDQAYTFRFRYQAKLALSVSVTTNNFLTDNPDIYLAASIVWGGMYIRDENTVIGWKTLLDEFVAEANHIAAQSKRSILSVDDGLYRASGRGAWTGIEQ